MKRRLSLLLSILLVLTFILPIQSYAQYDKELENAIKKAKTLFGITDEYDKFNYNINKYGNSTEYYLNWYDSANKLGNKSVTIDSDGMVRSYYSYKSDNENYEPKLPKTSKTDGLKIANDFIKKVSPELVSKIEYQESNAPLNVYDRNYYYDFIRVENGIPYYNNSVYVSVNNITGEIQSYGISWDKSLVFPDKNDILSLEEAKQAFKDKIGLELAYKLDYNSEEVKPFLVYTAIDSNKLIDAKTGEVINNRYGIAYDLGVSEKSAMDESNVAGLSPEELAAVENAKDIISEVEAEKFARAFLNIPNSYKLNSINLYSDWNNKENFVWSLYFLEDSNDMASSISLEMNAKSKEVNSFYKYNPYFGDEVVKYDEEQSLQLAKDFIESVQKDRYAQVEYLDVQEPIFRPLENEEMPRQNNFYFTRKANDAYFLGNGFNVGVDAVTGEIYQYNFTWHEGELPATDKVMAVDKAYDVFFNDIGYELQYTVQYKNDKYIYDDSNKEIKLVYAPKMGKPLNIDAFSGELLYDYGTAYKEEAIPTYSDIADSYAKMQIEILAEYGISLPGSEFKPKQTIAQKDFLYLLAKAKNYYFDMYDEDGSQVDKLYNYLINARIVKEGEKSPESNVSKQDAVKFIVRALGYDKVADIKDIYKVEFKDSAQISPELLGYVAIAEGLNIVSGSEGNFNPGSNLTREQSAVIIYNYLNVN